VSPLSSMRSPVIGREFRYDPQCVFVEETQRNSPHEPGSLHHDYLSESTRLILNELYEKCAGAGLEVSPDELRELGIFTTFVSSRVKPNAGISVSCMALWAEWVRFFLKHMNTFPTLIYEEEFRNLIVSLFECGIADDENYGPVYPGIEFIPGQNIPIHVTDSTFARA